MGDYKDKHHKTRVGQFLSSIGSPLAKTVLSIVGSATGITQLGTLADSIRTSKDISDDNKQQALELLEMDMVEMREITKRWQSDNESDNKLAKTARPITLLSMVSVFFILIFMDSMDIQFEVREIWIKMFETILGIVIVSFFGSRGIEKVKKIGKS